MTRPRWSGGSSAPVWVSAIVLSLAAAAWWPQPAVSSVQTSGWRMQAEGTVFGSVAITSVDTLPVWTAPSDSAVTVHLTNTTSGPVEAGVWWILGRLDDPHPWTDPVVESEHVTVTVPPNGTELVKIPALRILPTSGSLALSTWVHTPDPATGQYVHSDGVGMTAPLTINTAQSGILSLSKTSTLLRLVRVDTPERIPSGSPVPVTTSVVDDSPRDMVVSTAVVFVGPDGPMEVQLPAHTIGAGQLVEMTEFASAPGHAGHYQVSVRVDLVGPDGRRYPVAGLATPTPLVVGP